HRIRLAPPPAGGAVGPVDLQHDLVVGGQEASQPSTVTAGAFHPECLDLAQALGPGQQRPIAPGVVATRVAARWRPSWSKAQATCTSPWVSTPMVTLGGSSCAMVVMAVSLLDKGRWLRRPSGRTALRRVCGDRLLSGHVRSAGARLDDDRGPGRQLTAK